MFLSPPVNRGGCGYKERDLIPFGGKGLCEEPSTEEREDGCSSMSRGKDQSAGRSVEEGDSIASNSEKREASVEEQTGYRAT